MKFELTFNDGDKIVQLKNVVTAYIDFETTAPTDCCPDPEDKNMFAVSYVIIFAFNLELDLERVIIECSFGHSIEKPFNFRLFDQRSNATSK